MKNWWYWNGDIVGYVAIYVVFVVSIVASAVVGMGLIAANTYKYNCHLDRKPSFYTAFMIDDSTYAYDPAGFCANLKQHMEADK